MIPLIVGFIAGAVYIVTQAPGLYYTDTGELAAAAAVWGVAHPTGYPLFTLIAHVWTMLPWPSVVGGLNVLAALLMAASASMLTIFIRDLLGCTAPDLDTRLRTFIGAAVALLWAFSPTIWAQSTAIEVYALNTLLFVLTLHSLLNSYEQRTTSNQPLATRHSLLTGLLFGLMLANHISSIFLAPGLLYWWWKGRAVHGDQRRLLPFVVASALMGPLLYILLPLRSAALPPINWGWVHRGWDAFLYHVKGTQFGVWMFSDTKAMNENVNTFFSLASAELLWVGWILALFGAFVLWRSQRHIAIAMMLLILGNLGISLGYAIPDIDAYFIPTLTLLSVLFAIALPKVLRGNRRLVYAAPVIGVAALVLNFSAMDHSKHRAVPAYTQWALDNAEPNAIIITRQWDYLCSAFWYLQTIENVRTDITMIDKELLRRTWYAPFLQQRYPEVMKGASIAVNAYMPWLEQFERDADAFTANPNNNREIQARFVSVLNAILETNISRPIYITPELMNEEQGFAVNYRTVPAGPLIRLYPPSDTTFAARAYNSDEKSGTLETVVTSLQGRTSRLDLAMKEMVLSDLATCAFYAFQVQQDVGSFRFYRDMAIRLDPKHRLSRTLANQPLP